MLSTFSELRLNFMLTWSTFIANDFFKSDLPPLSSVPALFRYICKINESCFL